MNRASNAERTVEINSERLGEQSTVDAETIGVQSTLAKYMMKMIEAGAQDLEVLMSNVVANRNSSQIATSKTQIPISKIQKGMVFVDYKDLVSKWVCMTDRAMRAMILNMERPLNDAHGGLQRTN